MLTITVTIKQLISLIKKSTLDTILKESIIDRLKDDDILEVVKYNTVFCDMDACFDCYENITGSSGFDSKGNEKADVEPFIIQHFKNNCFHLWTVMVIIWHKSKNFIVILIQKERNYVLIEHFLSLTE